MKLLKQDKITHTLFDVSILFKGLNGVLEIIGGVLLLVIPPTKISALITFLSHSELIEDPNDKLANYLLHASSHLSINSELFGSLYLLSHGIIKVALIAALLKKKLFAYPLAIFFFAMFIVYQLYRYTSTYSPSLIALSILDAAIIILTLLEYKRIRTQR